MIFLKSDNFGDSTASHEGCRNWLPSNRKRHEMARASLTNRRCSMMGVPFPELLLNLIMSNA
jgi:hypothetical protein